MYMCWSLVMGLGAGIVGAFEDKALAQALKLPAAHEPLLVMPVGYKHLGQKVRLPRAPSNQDQLRPDGEPILHLAEAPLVV